VQEPGNTADLEGLRARLYEGIGSVTGELVDDFRSHGEAGIALLLDVLGDESLYPAPVPRGQAPVAAAAIVGELATTQAVPILIGTLRGAETDDQLSAQAMASLERIGVPAIENLVRFISDQPEGYPRELALDSLMNIVMATEPPELESIFTLLVNLYQNCRHPADRALYCAYLGDLGVEKAVEVILQGLKNPDLTEREYETLREAVARLGGICPEFYFDENEQGYPLDQDGIPHCMYCGQSMNPEENGALVHCDLETRCILEDIAHRRAKLLFRKYRSIVTW